MKIKTREVFDNIKNQAEEAAAAMDCQEREELYSSIHEWAYGNYQDALLEGYDGEPEMQDYEND